MIVVEPMMEDSVTSAEDDRNLCRFIMAPVAETAVLVLAAAVVVLDNGLVIVSSYMVLSSVSSFIKDGGVWGDNTVAMSFWIG